MLITSPTPKPLYYQATLIEAPQAYVVMVRVRIEIWVVCEQTFGSPGAVVPRWSRNAEILEWTKLGGGRTHIAATMHQLIDRADHRTVKFQ